MTPVKLYNMYMMHYLAYINAQTKDFSPIVFCSAISSICKGLFGHLNFSNNLLTEFKYNTYDLNIL